MISYSTNWMGPVSLQWFRARGLIEKQPPRWSELLQKEIELEEITQQWSGGRIDIRGEGTGPFGDETSLPIMLGEDYNRFSLWLDDYRTKEIQNFDQILEAYYKDGNPKIRFASETFD